MRIARIRRELSEKVCNSMIRLSYFLGIDKETRERIQSTDNYYFSLDYSEEEFKLAKNELNFFKKHKHFTLSDKNVLDVACGLGGKTVYFSQFGLKAILGIDNVHKKIEVAREFAKKRQVTNKVNFLTCDAAYLPFDSNCFDIIFINATMEHLYEPCKVLEECGRVLKYGGFLCINFNPYYHFKGHHIWAPVPIPWCHVFFSDKTLVNVVKKKNPHLRNFNSIDELGHLNKMTIKKFKKIIQNINLELKYFKVFPITYPLLYKSKYAYPLVFIAYPLIYIPFLNEFFSNQVVSIFKKSD